MLSHKRVISGAFLLVLFLVFTSKFDRFSGEMPLVWGDAFNHTMTKSGSSRPSRSVVIVTGPRRGGKSRALRHVAREMVDSGRLVVEIDPGKRAITAETLLTVAQIAFTKGLSGIRAHMSRQDLLAIHGIKTPFQNCSSFVPDFVDDAFARVYKGILGALEAILQDFSEISVRRFFDTLEAYANVLEPALFIHNVDTIRAVVDESGFPLGRRIIDAARHRLSHRDLYGDSVTVFVELQNSSRRLDVTDMSFRFTDTDIGDARSAFVTKRHLFSRDEFSKINSVLGSDTGAFARIFEDLKANVPLSNSVDAIRRMIASDLESVGMKGAAKLASDEFCRNGRLSLPDTNVIRALMPAIEMGYVHINDEMALTAANKEVTRTLCSKT